MWVAYSWATPSESMVSLQGRKIAALVQLWSVIIKIVSCPLDSGSFTMKSIAMVWKGRVSGSAVIRFRGGWFGFGFVLVIWHVAQPLMYSVT